jgi:hypothetical protein
VATRVNMTWLRGELEVERIMRGESAFCELPGVEFDLLLEVVACLGSESGALVHLTSSRKSFHPIMTTFAEYP